MLAPNFIERVRGRAWFKCVREGCKTEFSISDRNMMWLEHRDRPVPKYCRHHLARVTRPEEFEVQSPFFQFLPENIQGAIMWRTQRYGRKA